MMSAGDKRRMGLVPPQGAGCTLNGTLQRLIMIRKPLHDMQGLFVVRSLRVCYCECA